MIFLTMSMKWSLLYLAGLCILSFSQCQWPPKDVLCRPDDSRKSRCIIRMGNREMNTQDCNIMEINQYKKTKHVPECGQLQQNKLSCCALEEDLKLSDDSGNEESKTLCGIPCENNGHCTKRGTCRCKQGYHGKLCEKESKTLCGIPCENNGHCTKRGTCRCKQGYHGKLCEKEHVDDNIMSQILTLLGGTLIGGFVTGVGCCCCAENVVECRKRIKGCHCCRKDGHVNVQRKPDSERPRSTRRDVTVEEVPIYNEADEISTPRIERPGSVHTYEKIQVRRDPSRYNILTNGRHGEITIDGSSIVTNEEPTRNRVENSVEVVEMANNEDRPLETTITGSENTSIDNSITANGNTAIGNPSPFYFTLAKVDNEGTVNACSQFSPVHIADDTQFPDDDRPYFILEKEIDESAIQHVSTSTDDIAHGKVDNVQSECAGTDVSENNTTHIECFEEK